MISNFLATYLMIGIVVMMLLVATTKNYTDNQKKFGIGLFCLLFAWPLLLLMKVLAEIILAFLPEERDKEDS